MKLLAAAAAALLSSQAVPPPVITDGRATSYFIDNDTLPRITCTTPPPVNGIVVGTGVWIGSDRLLTAEHVIEGHLNCRADGLPISLVRNDSEQDFAEVRGRNAVGLVVPYSCAPVVAGETYFMVGYSEAGTRIKVQTVVAIGRKAEQPGYEGQQRFRGSMWGGSSGGAIFNNRGVLVGIIASNLSAGSVVYEMYGVMLADTFLCRENDRF